MSTRERATCEHCGVEMAVHVPRWGDGSILVFPAHPRGGPYCRGTYDRVVGKQFSS